MKGELLVCQSFIPGVAMSDCKLKFVYHNNHHYFWKEHEMMIPTVPISMKFNTSGTVFEM